MLRTNSSGSSSFAAVQRRALDLHQHVDRDRFRVLRQIGQLLQHARAVGAALAHPQDAAGADVDARIAHELERIQAILEGARGDHVAVELGRGVEIVIVVVETGIAQAFGLRPGQHAQGHAGLHAQTAHRGDHLDHLVEILVGRVAPGRAHAEASEPLALAACAASITSSSGSSFSRSRPVSYLALCEQ